MKNFLIALSLTAIILNVNICFSQEKTPPPAEQYFYSNSSGDISSPMNTTTQPEIKMNPEKERLLSLLRQARLSDDVVKVREYQSQLDIMDGQAPSPEYINNPIETGMQETSQQFTPQSIELDGVVTIGGAAYWAIATQTTSKSSAIFTAVTEFVDGASDKISVYVSYNHGVTWIKKGEYNGFVSGVKCRPGELDVEPVINGADTMLFVVAGYTYSSRAYSFIGRYNIGTGVVSAESFSFSLGSTQNYDPRITSDNTLYGSGTYVYITVANDSLLAGNNHRLRQRFCVIQNPLAASFTQTHRMANSNGGGSFFWYSGTAPDGTYIYQDIGYYSTGTADRIYTTVIYTNSQNVFNAWSDDFGATNAGSLNIVETRDVKNTRIAFNGGGSNQNGAVVYLRNYSTNPAGDVDVRSLNTNTGGTTLASFEGSNVEFTTDTATSCDIQAVKLANNKFKFAYSVKTTDCYYRSNTSQTGYSDPFKVNNFPAGNGFGRVRAGYRVTSDSCLAIWSTNTGGGAFSTYGCSLTGIQPVNNTTPGAYVLAQNFPNPFNPSTKIYFSIPENTFAKLKVYDILGKEIAVLVNEKLNAGNYSYEFNGAGLASGIYFYKLETEGYTAIKKMTLLK